MPVLLVHCGPFWKGMENQSKLTVLLGFHCCGERPEKNAAFTCKQSLQQCTGARQFVAQKQYYPKNVLLLEMLILQSIYSLFKMDWPFLACAPVLSTTAARSGTSHCHNGAKVSSQGWGWCCWPQSGACKKPLKQGDGGVLENHCISISSWNSSQFLARMNNSLGTINRESPAVLCAEAHGAVCKPPCEDVVLHRHPTCSQPHVPVNSRFSCAFASFEPAGRF